MKGTLHFSISTNSAQAPIDVFDTFDEIIRNAKFQENRRSSNFPLSALLYANKTFIQLHRIHLVVENSIANSGA